MAITVQPTEIREIRRAQRLSQAEFAARYGLVLGTLRQWEQGQRKPNAIAALALLLIRDYPDEVAKVVKDYAKQASRKAKGKRCKS